MSYLEGYYAGIRCEKSATRMVLYKCKKDGSRSLIAYPDYSIPELCGIDTIEILERNIPELPENAY